MRLSIILLFLIVSYSCCCQISDFKNIDFKQADSVAAIYKGEDLNNLPILSYKLTNTLKSDVEKFRAIYTWVCSNIDNDYNYYLKNKRKREKLQEDTVALTKWNKLFASMMFKKLLKEKKTVCTGYAYLVSELAKFAEIQCLIIDGYGRTVIANIGEPGRPNHSWNAVNLNNKWYLCDPTWSSGSINISENKYKKDYNDGYFLAEPQLFAKNHFPLESDWQLLKNKSSLNEFLYAPLIYKNAFNNKLIPSYPKKMKQQIFKNDLVEFSFKVLTDSISLDSINLELSTGSKSRIVKPKVEFINDERILRIKYVFDRIGKFDVHVKVADQNIVSYTYTVKAKKKRN